MSARPETGLHSFIDDTKGEPPHQVSARALDANFARCLPADRGLLSVMRVSHSADGWFVDIPPPPSGTAVLGCIDGQVQWIATQDC